MPNVIDHVVEWSARPPRPEWLKHLLRVDTSHRVGMPHNDTIGGFLGRLNLPTYDTDFQGVPCLSLELVRNRSARGVRAGVAPEDGLWKEVSRTLRAAGLHAYSPIEIDHHAFASDARPSFYFDEKDNRIYLNAVAKLRMTAPGRSMPTVAGGSASR